MGFKVYFRKIVFVGALALAIVIGVIASPIIGSAQANAPQTTDTQIEIEKKYPNGERLGQHFSGTMRDTLAKTLGITVDELCTLRSSGKSIAQIGEEKGISSKDLVKKLTKARTEQVEQLFKDGKITADQKDRVLNDLESRIEEQINRTDVGKDHHGKGSGGKCNNTNN